MPRGMRRERESGPYVGTTPKGVGTDFNNFIVGSVIIPAGTHLKDNANDLPNLPNEFSPSTNVQKLQIIAFPLIILLLKGYDIPEGEIDDNDIYNKFGKAHKKYADWAFLHSKKYILDEEIFKEKAIVLSLK